MLHAWCGARLLRDLRDLRGIGEADPAGQLWAKAMADTPIEAHRIATTAREQGRDRLTDTELAIIDRLYTGALARARTDNPAGTTTVLAGHTRSLAARFQTQPTATRSCGSPPTWPSPSPTTSPNARPDPSKSNNDHMNAPRRGGPD